MLLILNCGSSSIKYAMFSPELKLLKSGVIENIQDHSKALKTFFGSMKKEEIKKISLIGHRIVHGGEKFTKATKITPQVLKDLEKISYLAPLHNPINILGIKICQKVFPKITNIGVFDTAFHESMEPEHFLYALPKSWYQKYGIRKYGFHGTSHHYLREEYKKTQKKKTGKIITCHLGNGSSITLIQNGKVIDTSMGFTPTDGVIMSTRSGSIDPAIIPHMIKKAKLSPDVIFDIINKKSGLLALSEKTGDMKTLLETQKKDPKAKLAIKIFINSVVKYIGSYAALANGVDAVIFSGGIGERSSYLRNEIKKNLTFLGKTKFLMIPTNEELMIAKECLLLKK